MILKKPYAFLIKNFKRIHFLIFSLNLVLLYYIYNVYAFFKDYELTKVLPFVDDLSKIYIKPIMFVLIGICLLFLITILILLFQKNKQVRLYVVMIVYYLILIIFLSLDAKYLNILQVDNLDPTLIRLFKDLNLLSLIIQSVFSLILLVRAIGFDIKKFDFGTDIVELDIDVTDNEEVELVTGFDLDKFSGKNRKRLRELKYFYLENKLILIGGIILFVVSIFSYNFIKTKYLNVNYKESQTVFFETVELRINKSYVSKYDYNGNEIDSKNTTFVIIDFSIKNVYSSELRLVLDNLKLEIENNVYTPYLRKYESFVDIGLGYNDQRLKIKETKNYILVFHINKEDIEKQMIFKYADTKKVKDNKVIVQYKKIDLTPIVLNEIIDEDNAILNKILELNLSTNNNVKLNILDYGFSKKIDLNIDNKEVFINSSYNNVIVSLQYDFEGDNTKLYFSNIIDFLSKFSKIVYIVDGQTYSSDVKNVTPSKYNGDNMFFEVDAKIEKAEKIYFEIVVRNNKYIYNLK